LSNILRKTTFVKLATVYLPIIIGLILTTTGAIYYMEATRSYPLPTLPKYGIINLASSEFSPVDIMRVTIRDMSVAENYMEVIVQLSVETKEKQVNMFSLQVPYRVDTAYGKISYTDSEKTNTYIDHGDAKVEWMPENDVSIITYDFKGEPATSQYGVEIGFQWHGVISKTGYSTYELLIPFSRVSNLAVDPSSGLAPNPEEIPVVLTVYLPAETRLIDSIPQPSEVVIDWQDSNVGLKSLVFNADVDFGMTPGWANLPSFKITLDVPQAQNKYNRLIFDSGLFLGIGIQFLIAGIFDAIRARSFT